MNDTHQVIGVVLVVLGVLDPLLGVLLVAPRLPRPETRRTVILALVASGLIMMGLGTAFLGGLFS